VQLAPDESQPSPVPRQSPGPAVGAGQVAVPHELAVWHETSHSHASAQPTTPHALLPLQLTAQSPKPHVMSPHALLPSHSSVHDAACVQSTSPHALEAMQLIVQSKPVGQTRSLQPFGVLQVIVQLIAARSQLVQPGGHGGASGGGGVSSVMQ